MCEKLRCRAVTVVSVVVSLVRRIRGECCEYMYLMYFTAIRTYFMSPQFIFHSKSSEHKKADVSF